MSPWEVTKFYMNSQVKNVYPLLLWSIWGVVDSPFQPLPLEKTVKIHAVQIFMERFSPQVVMDRSSSDGKEDKHFTITIFQHGGKAVSSFGNASRQGLSSHADAARLARGPAILLRVVWDWLVLPTFVGYLPCVGYCSRLWDTAGSMGLALYVGRKQWIANMK